MKVVSKILGGNSMKSLHPSLPGIYDMVDEHGLGIAGARGFDITIEIAHNVFKKWGTDNISVLIGYLSESAKDWIITPFGKSNGIAIEFTGSVAYKNG